MFLKEQQSCHKSYFSTILIAFFAFKSLQVLKGKSKLGSCMKEKPKQLIRKFSFPVLCLENLPSGLHTAFSASAIDIFKQQHCSISTCCLMIKQIGHALDYTGIYLKLLLCPKDIVRTGTCQFGFGITQNRVDNV